MQCTTWVAHGLNTANSPTIGDLMLLAAAAAAAVFNIHLVMCDLLTVETIHRVKVIPQFCVKKLNAVSKYFVVCLGDVD